MDIVQLSAGRGKTTLLAKLAAFEAKRGGKVLVLVPHVVRHDRFREELDAYGPIEGDGKVTVITPPHLARTLGTDYSLVLVDDLDDVLCALLGKQVDVVTMRSGR